MWRVLSYLECENKKKFVDKDRFGILGTFRMSPYVLNTVKPFIRAHVYCAVHVNVEKMKLTKTQIAKVFVFFTISFYN